MMKTWLLIAGPLAMLAAWTGFGADGETSMTAQGESAARTITLPEGASLRVRLTAAIDTKVNHEGDEFHAVLDQPVMAGGRVLLPAGADCTGRLVAAKQSGRLAGKAAIVMTLESITWKGKKYKLQTATVDFASGGHTKRNLAWIGGSSAGGALIGGLAGGGKGALIGAAAGGAGGTGVAAATGKQQVRLPAETRLSFTLEAPVRLTA